MLDAEFLVSQQKGGVQVHGTMADGIEASGQCTGVDEGTVVVTEDVFELRHEGQITTDSCLRVHMVDTFGFFDRIGLD